MRVSQPRLTVLQGFVLYPTVRAGFKNTPRGGGTINVVLLWFARAAGHAVHNAPQRWAVFVNLDNINVTQLIRNYESIINDINFIAGLYQIIPLVPNDIFMIVLRHNFRKEGTRNWANDCP